MAEFVVNLDVFFKADDLPAAEVWTRNLLGTIIGLEDVLMVEGDNPESND